MTSKKEKVSLFPCFSFSLEKRVKEIVHKAFWNCLEAQLNDDPPVYEHAIKLVGEIKEVRRIVRLP